MNVVCGGTIINDEYVVTAGHCCALEAGQNEGIIVEIGQYNTNKEDIGEFQVFVEEYFIHPDYNEDDGFPRNDICLLRVPSLSGSAPSDCDDCYRPACVTSPGTNF